MPFTDTTVHDWLETVSSSAWCSLHYDSPALDGLGGSEISGGSYARVKIVFAAPSNRAMWATDDVVFAGLPATQVTHFGIWSLRTKGSLIAYGTFPTRRIVPAGRGIVIPAGDLVLSLG